tara:strand:- start:173 stop:538 length:366 start_codon:yes stop_codon:yes gene_type:complete
MSSNKEWHLQPPSKTRYGYNGLLQKFAFLDINASDWIIKKLDIERGGIEFMLPNAEGKIYLGWSDLYHVDIDFVNSKKNFTSQVTLGELDQILVLLEEQRQSFKKTMANMLKEAFSKSEEE